MDSQSSILIYQSLDEIDYASYQNDFILWISKTFPTIPLFHLDSYSSPDIFDLGKKLLTQSDRCLFVMLFGDQSNVQGLPGLLNEIRTIKDNKVDVFTMGSHALIAKMQNMLNVHPLKDYPGLKNKTREWINAG